MEYATEEQQVEAIKDWFKKHSNTISWFLLIFALTFSAIYYWRHHRQVLQARAQEQYVALLLGVDKNEQESIERHGQNLKENYPKSVYATLGSFILANYAVTEKKQEVAEQNLKWIIENSKESKFQALARLRLMRLLISQDKLKEALEYYDENKANGFLTLMAELKGDILFQQKDISGARAAYEKALKAAPEEGMHGVLLKMKLNEVGATTPKAKEVDNENS